MRSKKPLIGFVGQGWIGRAYADNFEERGYSVVRYSLEKEYVGNKNKIKDCDIVFIAVWTPTTPNGFDDSVIRSVLKLVGKGKIAVIKSTILPGTTEKIQEDFPEIVLLYGPEFLSVASHVHDAAHPFANLVGMSINDAKHLLAAERVTKVLPKAPFSQICSSTEAFLPIRLSRIVTHSRFTNPGAVPEAAVLSKILRRSSFISRSTCRKIRSRMRSWKRRNKKI